MIETCATCKWYAPERLKVGVGDCRRYPPSAVVEPGTGMAPSRISMLYPKVRDATDGCGEHAQDRPDTRSLFGEAPGDG